MMETNRIIEELKAVALLDWNPEQKAFYEQRAADAKPVECVPMRDVFTPEQLRFLWDKLGYRTQQKMCYRNAAELVRLIAGIGAFTLTTAPIRYVRVTRIVANCYPLNTRLSRLGINTLTRRLNGHCIGMFGKNYMFLALNWTRKRWPVTNWKPAFTGNCTNTIICARIGRNWRNRYGRGIRTTADENKNPTRENSTGRGGPIPKKRYGVKGRRKDKEFWGIFRSFWEFPISFSVRVPFPCIQMRRSHGPVLRPVPLSGRLCRFGPIGNPPALCESA